MTIRLEGDLSRRQAIVTDAHGSLLFQGGITTLSDQLRVPPHIWTRISRLIDPFSLSPRSGPQVESDSLWERRDSSDWL